MLSVFEKAGVMQDFYCACEDARTAMSLAEKGFGIAILPASMMKYSGQLRGPLQMQILQLKSCLYGGKRESRMR